MDGYLHRVSQLVLSTSFFIAHPKNDMRHAVLGQCYSCASTNMKSNFISKQRGPPNRRSDPLTFDNNCNEDPWIIKQMNIESLATFY
uniref:Secreted protein n=1 Tax=Heterorhabditis bacteriophora TaxID=37862 RepID=A0A1I7XLN4_HETBA